LWLVHWKSHNYGHTPTKAFSAQFLCAGEAKLRAEKKIMKGRSKIRSESCESLKKKDK